MNRRSLTALVAGALVMTLAACGGGGATVPDTVEDTSAYPVVADGQARSILQAVDGALARGIDVKDTKDVDARLVGPFRQFQIADAKADAQQKKRQQAPETVERTRLVVPVQREWPRFFIAVGTSTAESTPVLQVLSSDSAQAPYGLWAQATMLPGATLPETASISSGSPVVSADASGLVLAPEDVLKHYAAYLNANGKGAEARTFAGSTYSDQIFERLKDDQKMVKGAATLTGKHVTTDQKTWSVRTADGSALVIGVLQQDYKVTVKKGQHVDVKASLAALAGGKTSIGKSFDRTALEVLVFKVPPRGSGKITVIAAQKADIAAVAK